MPNQPRLSAKEKQQRYRTRLRSQGLRPVQIWVPDTKAPGFEAECRRQAERVNRAADERETLDFIDDIADWDEE
jgi:hypothetical protein